MGHRGRIAATGLMAALALPGAAAAKGGQPAPPPTAAPCAGIASSQPSRVFSGGGRVIDLGWSVSNCSAATETLTVTATPRVFRVVGTTVSWCYGTPFPGGTLTLKPGETKSLKTVAPPDDCMVPDRGLSVLYDATVAVPSGAPLAATTSAVTINTKA